MELNKYPILMFLEFSIQMVIFIVWIVYLNNLRLAEGVECAKVAPRKRLFLKIVSSVYLCVSILIIFVNIPIGFSKDTPISLPFKVVLAFIYACLLWYIQKIEKSKKNRQCDEIAQPQRLVAEIFAYFGLSILIIFMLVKTSSLVGNILKKKNRLNVNP